MHIDRVRDLLDRARTKRILVVGDLMLDEYLWGEVTRISPEAPVPVVRLTGESWYPGGAANVARNVHAFSGWTGVLGITGRDEGGRRIVSALDQAGIDSSGILQDSAHITTVKTRIVAKHQQVVRVDRERIEAPTPEIRAAAIDTIDRLIQASDAVIVSDYAKGFLSQEVIDHLQAGAARHGIIFTVDPSPLNPLDWCGATAIKPNRAEALRAAGLHELSSAIAEDGIVPVGEALLEKWRARLILLTLGEQGMLLFERGHPVFRIPSRAREVFDVSGAGDTAIAIFTIALCAGAQPAEAAELANRASGIVVGKLGTAIIMPAELIADFEAGG